MATGGRQRSLGSDVEDDGGATAPSRRRSIGYEDEDEDEDEERAAEIENLKNRGILPQDFPAPGADKCAPPKRVDSVYNVDDEEISEEIQQLLTAGAITNLEADIMRQNHEDQKVLNSMCVTNGDVNGVMLPFEFDRDGQPMNWSPMDSSQRTSMYELVELFPGQHEYDKISEEFSEAGVEIKKVERLQSVYLLDRFKTEMDHMKRRRPPGFQFNVRYLYHGTNVEKSRMCEKGLDQRLSRMGFFGKGIYFSDTPIKCVHYGDNADQPDEAYILKCRVILGESKAYEQGQYDTTLKREPEKENQSAGWRYYDSVMGCPKDYNEFVVYENRHAMIEYIIAFKINANGLEELRRRAPSPKPTAKKNIDPPLAEPPTEEEHFRKIQEVREAIRKKRAAERGDAYYEPTIVSLEEDRHTWIRLLKLHGVESTPPLLLEENVLSRIRPPVSTTTTSTATSTAASRSTSVQSIGSSASGRSAGLMVDDVDPVEEVLSSLAHEFMGVTNIDDMDLAKEFVREANMDVSAAIMNFFEANS